MFYGEEEFQSLSRDSGRLNSEPESPPPQGERVSIPQSGFGAFELEILDDIRETIAGCFNPSVGIRGV